MPDIESLIIWHHIVTLLLCSENPIIYTAIATLHWKKKWSHFDLKIWVTGRTKIRPAISSSWRIFESNWFDIENKFKLTLNIESIDSIQIESKLTQIKSYRVKIDSIQIDAQYRVNLTQIFSNYSESRVEF